MTIDDFEWEGESVTVAEPAAPAREGAWARLRKSVWLEPALRLFGMALLLGVLAGIGVVATTYAKPGVALPAGAQPLVAALGTSWLKPTAPVVTEPTPTPAHGVEKPAAAAPTVAEAGAAPLEPPADAHGPVGVTLDGKVILNLASADELTKLPGVGMKRAQAIVALRTKLKRFKQPTDLLRVKGIGPRGLKRMLPHLVLDAPAG